MIEKSALSDLIDTVLQDEARVTTALVPELAQPGDQALQRLQIEAARRIWATADINAMALVAMLGEDYEAARKWAAYLESAMNRDKKLLEQLGVDASQVRATAPLRATVAMIETTARSIYGNGSLPAVAYAVFIEWRDNQSKEIASLLESGIGKAKNDDHQGKVLDLAHRLIARRPDGLPLFVAQLRQTSAFMRAGFAEVLASSPAISPQGD